MHINQAYTSSRQYGTVGLRAPLFGNPQPRISAALAENHGVAREALTFFLACLVTSSHPIRERFGATAVAKVAARFGHRLGIRIQAAR